MAKSISKALVALAALVFGAVFILAGIFAPTNDFVVKLPLMSLMTEIDHDGNLIIRGTGADARWLEIGQGIFLLIVGYMYRPEKWEL